MKVELDDKNLKEAWASGCRDVRAVLEKLYPDFVFDSCVGRIAIDDGPGWSLEEGKGGVNLMFQEDDGSDWVVIGLREDGTFYRYRSVGACPLKRDASGRIKEGE